MSPHSFAVQLGHDQVAVQVANGCTGIGRVSEPHCECASGNVEFSGRPFHQMEDVFEVAVGKLEDALLVFQSDDHKVVLGLRIRPAVPGNEPVAGSSENRVLVVLEVSRAERTSSVVSDFSEDLPILG